MTRATAPAAVRDGAAPRRGGGWRGAGRGWWRGADAAVASPNADARPQAQAVELLIVHSISLPPGEFGGDAVERLFTNRLDAAAHPYYAGIAGLRVSAHFFVRRDGRVVQFVGVDRRAWHAGVSCWRGRERCNDHSVGVELEGLEGGSFEPAQYASLARLAAALSRRLPALAEAVGHEHVAPGRKHDPGPGFDWTLLSRIARWPRRVALPVAGEAATARAGEAFRG